MRQRIAEQIDAKGMLHVLGGDRAAYDEIVGLFLSDLPQQLQRLQTRWVSGGAPLCEALHELAGACGAVGARRAEDVLRAMERRFEGKKSPVAESLEEVLSMLRRLAEGLTNLRGEIGGCRERS